MKKGCHLLCILLTVLGCSTSQTILNVENKVSPQKTSEEVKTAILIAGVQKGWTMTSAEPGRIDGKISVRNRHRAHIEIRYDASGYRIHYLDSQGLDADAAGTIHRNYNKWITLLDQAIQVELMRQPTGHQ